VATKGEDLREEIRSLEKKIGTLDLQSDLPGEDTIANAEMSGDDKYQTYMEKVLVNLKDLEIAIDSYKKMHI